ncbi:S1 RNA-binding domain-containing protein 1-like [Arvicola amphibius]|uniref:S1 RNA-binding domain-containing protein 1-like n=1 Tax=Arvicola amphibius TaxID=1047088 RepID=UPI001C08EB98|nr:S1 RNA-binding domain-containing protein 1-like [Arvicola amphibius]
MPSDALKELAFLSPYRLPSNNTAKYQEAALFPNPSDALPKDALLVWVPTETRKRHQTPLELELQVVVSCPTVGAGDQTQILEDNFVFLVLSLHGFLECNQVDQAYWASAFLYHLSSITSSISVLLKRRSRPASPRLAPPRPAPPRLAPPRLAPPRPAPPCRPAPPRQSTLGKVRRDFLYLKNFRREPEGSATERQSTYTPGRKMSSLPRRAKIQAQNVESKNELSFFSEMSSGSEEDDKEDSIWEPQKKVPRNCKQPASKESKQKQGRRVKKNTPQMEAVSKDLAVKEELNSPVAIVDASLEEKNHKLHTTKALKTATKNQKNSVQRAKRKLKVDEVTSQASPLEGGDSNMEIPSTSTTWEDVCKKEESEDDFTFGQSPLKRLKTEACPQGKPVKFPDGASSIKEEVEMNWDIVQVLSERTNIELWVCANIIRLFNDDNTIPFIIRYRKELVNNLDADSLREVRQTLDELRAVAKKVHSTIQKIKKEGKMSECLLKALLNCKTFEELEHVSAPYKTGSKGTKAQRAKQLGLEGAARLLLENPGPAQPVVLCQAWC